MNFKGRIARHDTLLGTVLSLVSPEVAEIASRAGFDWLWIDMEHAPANLLDVQRMIQAVAGRVATVVRVPANDPIWIQRALDLGCDGVVVPHVRSAADAQTAVRACFYPPQGTRSVGFARAQGYGKTLQEYANHAESELCVILQIEDRDAVEQIETIVAVPGIDALLIGPYDLSGAYGVLGDTQHDLVVGALSQIKHANVGRTALGIFAADATAAKKHIADGISLIAVGMDALFLWQGMDHALRAIRAPEKSAV